MAIHAATTTRIAFLGDSITAGWLDSGVPPNPNPSQRWQAGLETNINTRFGSLGYSAPTYSNFGVGGQTSVAMAAGVASAVAVHPQHVFVLSSVNDPANNIKPVTVQSAYEQMAQAFWADNPNVRIHVVSNLFYGGAELTSEKVPDSTNPHAAEVIALNEAIRCWTLLHPDRVEYLDVRADALAWEIANNLGNAPNGLLTQSSGTHLTATGQGIASTGAWNRITVTT